MLRTHRKLAPAIPPRLRQAPRRGFTLVELLVVITVIVILIGLLIPAVGRVRVTVRNAAVQSEVNRIAAAVTSFKSKYGIDPPSSIRLCEDASDWSNYPRDRAIIRQLWPQFDFSYAGLPSNELDINGNGNSTEVCNLQPGEVLVFFLGGIPTADTASGTTQWSLRGFTKNPQRPFSQSADANRDAVIYDFDSSRLQDVDNDGFPEFRDSYPSQRNPLLYYSSYDGNGYRFSDTNEFPAAPTTFPRHPYLQGSDQNAQPYGSKSFQIISPGADGEYGIGGPYLAGATVRLPGWTRNVPTPVTTFSADDRKVEADNITNFGNGPLQP